MRSKLLAGAGVAIAATAAFSTSAFAGSGSVSPNTFAVSTVLPSTATTNISWSGFTSTSTKYVYICNATDALATFDWTTNCESLSEIPFEGGSTATNVSYTFPVNDKDNVNGDWLCAAPGTVAPAGYTLYSTCYVRVTQTQGANVTDDFFAPVTFTAASTVVPQFPTSTVAVSATAAVAALAAGFFLLRSRRNSVA